MLTADEDRPFRGSVRSSLTSAAASSAVVWLLGEHCPEPPQWVQAWWGATVDDRVCVSLARISLPWPGRRIRGNENVEVDPERPLPGVRSRERSRREETSSWTGLGSKGIGSSWSRAGSNHWERRESPAVAALVEVVARGAKSVSLFRPAMFDSRHRISNQKYESSTGEADAAERMTLTATMSALYVAQSRRER